jgi:hypothetical protein
MRNERVIILQGITIGILAVILFQMLIHFRVLQERVLLLHERLDQQEVSAQSLSPFVYTPQLPSKRPL